MSEEAKTDIPMKRKGGWPKGKPRTPVQAASEDTLAPAVAKPVQKPNGLLAKMKARPNWDDDTFAAVGEDGVDKLHIPREIVEALAKDGVALQWVTRSVRGQEAPRELAKFTKGGWTPVHNTDFDGVLDGMFLNKGEDDVITLDDCMLVARPIQIQQKAALAMNHAANEPVKVTEAQIGRGIPGVTGSDHISAVRGNSIKKTFERIAD